MNIVKAMRTARRASRHEGGVHDDDRADTAEIGGIGHSVKRHEDDRFIAGQGQLPRRHHAARDAAHGDPAQRRSRTRGSTRSTRRPQPRSRASSPSSPASSWRSTTSPGCRRCRATRRPCSSPTRCGTRARRSRRVIADRPLHRGGRARADRRRLRAAAGHHDARSRRSRPDAPLIRDEKEGQTDNRVYQWEAGDKDATDARVRGGRPRRRARDALPALAPGAARDVRLHRRRQPGDRPGDDLYHVAGAARPPHAVRDGRRAARAGHPDHQPGPRRRLRQQGADLPGLRRRDRRLAADRPAGEVDRGPHREPDLDRVRPRLPHEGRAGGHERREDARPPGRRCSPTRAPSTPTRSRRSSGPGCSTSSPAATTSRPRT